MYVYVFMWLYVNYRIILNLFVLVKCYYLYGMFYRIRKKKFMINMYFWKEKVIGVLDY